MTWDVDKPDKFNSHGYNRDVFQKIEQYYKDKADKIPKMLNFEFDVDELFKINMLENMPDEENFDPESKVVLSKAISLYIYNTWKIYMDTYTIMRIFKRFNTKDRKFTQNVILHHGDAHATTFKHILRKLGKRDIEGDILPITEHDVGEPITDYCYKINGDDDGNITFFGKSV